MKPLRTVNLRTWRGPGAPGGWHVTARVLNRHGHIKKQIDARELMGIFMYGASTAEVAFRFKLPVYLVEEIIRKMGAKDYD